MVQNESNAPAHPMGAMAVSFAPALEAGALVGRGKKQVCLCTLPTVSRGASFFAVQDWCDVASLSVHTVLSRAQYGDLHRVGVTQQCASGPSARIMFGAWKDHRLLIIRAGSEMWRGHPTWGCPGTSLHQLDKMARFSFGQRKPQIQAHGSICW